MRSNSQLQGLKAFASPRKLWSFKSFKMQNNRQVLKILKLFSLKKLSSFKNFLVLKSFQTLRSFGNSKPLEFTVYESAPIQTCFVITQNLDSIFEQFVAEIDKFSAQLDLYSQRRRNFSESFLKSTRILLRIYVIHITAHLFDWFNMLTNRHRWLADEINKHRVVLHFIEIPQTEDNMQDGRLRERLLDFLQKKDVRC